MIKIFVTVSCIFLGLLIDLGWKEISLGYKRNYQTKYGNRNGSGNGNEAHGSLEEPQSPQQRLGLLSFHSQIEWKGNHEMMFQEIHQEFQSLLMSSELESDTNTARDWIISWNQTDEAVIDSKPLSGVTIPMSVTEVPLVRIRVNCSCRNPQELLNKFFSPSGLSLLHMVSAAAPPPLPSLSPL